MAGAVTAPSVQLTNPSEIRLGSFLIKNAEIINEGDLVGVDSNGFVVVASKTAGSIIKPQGIAFFFDNNGTGGARTGDGTTVLCGICRAARIGGITTTTVPSLAKGLPVYLGPTPTTSVSNYTCALTSTNGDAIVPVGYVSSDGKFLDVTVDINASLEYQTAGNSILTSA